MFDLGSSLVFKFMGKLFPFVVRLFFKPEKLSEKIEITVNPQDEGIRINAGQGASARVWLKITNFSPFPVEVDRIFCVLSLENKVADLCYLHRKTIEATKSELIFLDTSLSPLQVELIKLQKNTKEATLDLNAYFNCNICNFSITQKYVKSKNLEFINIG